jgi:hypothetical protein
MIVLNRLAGAAVLLTGLMAAGVSQASVIDFDGSMADLGTVAAGQTGVITNNFSGSPAGSFEFGTGSDYGFLPTDTAITFTYTYSNMAAGSLNAYDSYHYTSGGSVFSGSSSGTSSQAPVSVGYTNGAASAPLVLAAANLNSALTAGSTSFVNTSSGLAQFQSAFAGLFNSTGRVVSVSYTVSAVPLPAALPMFATVLAGLAAFAAYRKRRAV